MKRTCIRCNGYGVIDEGNIDDVAGTKCPRCKGTGIEDVDEENNYSS